MDIVNITKTEPGYGEITIKLGGEVKKYTFTYDDIGFFLFHFPENFQRLLNHLPVRVTQQIVSKIDKGMDVAPHDLPYEIEIEKEILALV